MMPGTLKAGSMALAALYSRVVELLSIWDPNDSVPKFCQGVFL